MESSLDNRSTPERNANLRAYLAGGGVTAALVAAAVIVFASLAAFVGFNGLPFGADDSADATVALASGAPEAAAVAFAPTAGAVAATPATPSDAALAEIVAALPPGAGAPVIDGTGTAPPGNDPVPAGPGSLGGAVNGLEDTAGSLGNLGLDLPLGGLTDDTTGPVDDAGNGTLNDAGGVLGDGKLGT